MGCGCSVSASQAAVASHRYRSDAPLEAAERPRSGKTLLPQHDLAEHARRRTTGQIVDHPNQQGQHHGLLPSAGAMATPELDIAICTNQMDSPEAQQAQTRTHKVSFAQKVSYVVDTSAPDSARSAVGAEASFPQEQGCAPSGFASYILQSCPPELVVLSLSQHSLEETVRPTAIDAARANLRLDDSSVWLEPPNFDMHGDVLSDCQINLGDLADCEGDRYVDIGDLADLAGSCFTPGNFEGAQLQKGQAGNEQVWQWQWHSPSSTVITGEAGEAAGHASPPPSGATLEENFHCEPLAERCVEDDIDSTLRELLQESLHFKDSRDVGCLGLQSFLPNSAPNPEASDATGDTALALAVVLEKKVDELLKQKTHDVTIVECVPLPGSVGEPSISGTPQAPGDQSLLPGGAAWTEFLKMGKPIPLSALPLLAPHSTSPVLSPHKSRACQKTPMLAAAQAALAFPWRAGTQSMLYGCQRLHALAPGEACAEPLIPASRTPYSSVLKALRACELSEIPPPKLPSSFSTQSLPISRAARSFDVEYKHWREIVQEMPMDKDIRLPAPIRRHRMRHGLVA